MFYANEHEPIHVHGKCQGRELRAEIIVINGIVSEIRYGAAAGRPPLEPIEQRYFEEIVAFYTDDIVKKWIDFLSFTNPSSPFALPGDLNAPQNYQYY